MVNQAGSVDLRLVNDIPVGNSSLPSLTATSDIKANIAASKAGRESSNFKIFSKNEGKIQEELGIWPPNSGGYATKPSMTLEPGMIVDRYGFPEGTFVSPVGTPFEERALPSSSLNKPYTQYEVLKSITPTSESKILPWFGQRGQGIQYKLPKSVSELLDPKNPYLREVSREKK
nr:TNT domain-containing protein [Acinetobacter sp. Marseille-Q1620]